MLDIPTLSIAVMLVMSLSSLALIAHWLANRKILGLSQMAIGLSSISLGSGLIFANAQDGSFVWVLVGYIIILFGQMWSWLGLADFWQALDAFEGKEYQRVPTTVSLADGTLIEAFVYELLPEKI